MRTDVTEILYADMTPELRALIAYEYDNGALNLTEPQVAIEKVLQETPVIRWEQGVGFFRMDDVVAAGRNPALVSMDPVTGESFGMGSEAPLIPLHLSGDLHRHYRKLLDPLFTPKRMALLEPAIRELADRLIDDFIDVGKVELHDAMCVPLPSIIFLNLFGMPLEDMPALNGFKNRILKNDGVGYEERERIGREAGRELQVLLRQRYEERVASGEHFDDLLDQFIHFEVDGQRLSDDDIVNIMQMFTIAGLDTVTSTMSCILGWLAVRPEERRTVVSQPELLAAAIEEIMRWESPVPSGGGRWATEDTEVNGVAVKKGDMVYLCWASANLDNRVFEAPMMVDFHRPENRHIVFAAGLHRCLGSHLARNEIRVAIDQFHRRIPDYWVPDGETIEYEFAGVRQARYLPVEFTATR